MAEATHSQEIGGNLAPGLGRGTKLVGGKVNGQDTETIDTGLDVIISFHLTATADGHIATANSVTGGVITVGLVDDAGSAIDSDEDIYWSAMGYNTDGTG